MIHHTFHHNQYHRFHQPTTSITPSSITTIFLSSKPTISFIILTSFSQRLKSSLWYSIGSIVDAIALDQDLNATPQFIGSLTELVWSQILTSGADLENFAKHAGRDTIDTKDVLLLVRRNEQLKEVLENALKDIKK
ncbi:hypothetical protein D6D08_09495 [Aureobasidium pullulans]|nr:hypothetical protein D6D08_09495 [Aureobasidium pullulans]